MHSARTNSRSRPLLRLIFVAALLAWPIPHPALAQTAVDEPQIPVATACDGHSVSGIYADQITGVPAEATVGACASVNAGPACAAEARR